MDKIALPSFDGSLLYTNLYPPIVPAGTIAAICRLVVVDARANDCLAHRPPPWHRAGRALEIRLERCAKRAPRKQRAELIVAQVVLCQAPDLPALHCRDRQAVAVKDAVPVDRSDTIFRREDADQVQR